MAPSFPGPSHAHRPPAKKRKRNYRNTQKHPRKPHQHWDDPGGASGGMVYDEQEGSAAPDLVDLEFAEVLARVGGMGEEEGEYTREALDGGDAMEEEEAESRPLTHEEIWDDSALIDAWASAEAEYEAYHGTSKAWKAEPVKKSPLWYNKPYTAASGPSTRPTSQSQAHENGEPEPDTAPLDFDTFVPTHDPSLATPSNGTTDKPVTSPTPFFVPPPSTMMVSRDEAFSNALSAVYWSGYWTAVYQCQSKASNDGQTGAIRGDGAEVDEDEDLIPAQR